MNRRAEFWWAFCHMFATTLVVLALCLVYLVNPL